ncbi:putative 3-deoxy-D-manno-octulosonic acid transferase, mitochondrial isoform X2 [Silene latifolia]|uniref:putative 3-deoxy-D-manno-octulosonic acid transferase, mitochondrial isoform X2 n=1 Tax=Silene latifolia TaxID=37657 RepID=UPI003D776AA8
MLFPADFYVIEMEPEKGSTPILLRRPFMRTSNTKIDVSSGRLTMEFEGEKIEYSIHEAMKYPSETSSLCFLEIFEPIVQTVYELCKVDPLNVVLTNGLVGEDTGYALSCELQETIKDLEENPPMEEWEEKEEIRKAAENSHRASSGDGKLAVQEIFFLSSKLLEELPKEKPVPSIVKPPIVELKPLPSHLKYAFLGSEETLPVIISSKLTKEQEEALIRVLKQLKEAIGWTMADIKGISPTLCMHRILLEDEAKPIRQPQRRLNPPMMDVVKKEIFLALLNARMSEKSFRRWSAPSVLPLITLMLSKFSLISPLSTTESIRFQLLQAPPLIISSSADLKYAVGRCAMSKNSLKDVEDLRLQLSHRPSWMASSIHKGEHEVILQAHKKLLQNHNSLLTVIVPRHPQHGYEFAQRLREEGFDVAVRPDGGKLTSATNVYMVNTLGELREFYRLMPIAVVGGSFLPDLAGHNISEAMASGCAVLTGPHIGHFSHMVSAMQRFNNLSVLQVSKESELITALHELLSDPVTLEARQSAAEQAFNALSSGVLAHVWIQLDRFILRKLPI